MTKNFTNILWKKTILFTVGFLVMLTLVFETVKPAIVQAASVEGSALFLPEVGERLSNRAIRVVATAYSSTVDQTDDTPFLTASQTYVRWGVVAANFLPKGTIVRFPDLYGDQLFVVEDRMNARYGNNRVDIWMEGRDQAREFGVKMLKMHIYKRP
ncbi:MAG: hypothetical protein HW383_468 [Candidatus Magasanikbacteria bacterium]|nr:hypothetical protein [Candidatus Magasanikbacteria bacterium]